MSTAVKKSVALSLALSKELAQIAREEGKTVSAVIQDALRESKRKRLTQSFLAMQGYWTRKAREKGILTERDLRKYLAVR
jgi:macrodomain Ter protein organizer (MatP/YcbG family)